MKREFLKGLNLDDSAIDKIMAENGRDIEGAKKPFADYEDVKSRLKAAEEAVSKFGDYDATKALAEKLAEELKAAKAESEAKIAKMEIESRAKDFAAGKKFVNDITRDAVARMLAEKLGSESAKGKSLDELFAEVTAGKTNVLLEENAPTPPVQGAMGGSAKAGEGGVLAAFRKLNPNLKLE